MQIEAQPVQHPDGYVAVINVEASIGQAIGVRITRAENVSDPDVPAYAFPVRDGDNTVWKHPEELHMLMLPGLRRTFLMLKRAMGQPAIVDFIYLEGKSSRGANGNPIEEVDEAKGIVRCGGLTIPLDQVASVSGPPWKIVWDQRGVR